MDKSKVPSWIWVVVVIILIPIIIYLIIFSSNNVEIKGHLKELNFDKEKVKHRHRKIGEVLETKIDLSKKLNRIFKWVYVSIRFILVGSFVLFEYGLYKFNGKWDLEEMLNLNESVLLVLMVISFLVFGTIKRIDNIMKLGKLKIENFIYGKYMDIDTEISELEKEKNELDLQLVSSQN